MKKKLFHLALAALCAAAPVISVAPNAHAQTEPAAQPAPAPTQAQDETRERIIVPRLSDRAPPGILADKQFAEPDWAAVKTLLRVTRERDAEFDRSLRAMTLTRVVSAEERERLRPKGLRPLAPAQLQRIAPEKVAIARLPVLAPVTAETAPNMRIAANENSFTVFGDLPDGATFELIGTRMRIVGGPPELIKARTAERRRLTRRLDAIDASYIISRAEDGIDLSFSKFNTAYQITVYCPSETDSRCADEKYVTSLAENLVILNEDAGGQ